jgi:pimeloyl-ACP methyl ester carboxylesterase
VTLHATSADGISIAIHELTHQPGRALLASHATGFCAHVFQPFAEAIADTHHVWAHDFGGHGASPVPVDYLFTWDRFGDDVLAVIDALELDHPVAIGHSMGGAALVMAEVRRPGTFAGLYLYEPILFPHDGPRPEGASPMVMAAQRRRSEFDSFDAAYDNFSSKPPLNVFHPAALRAYADHAFVATESGTVTLACRREFEAAIFSKGGEHEYFNRLGELTCPVVIAMGEPEPFGPANIAPRIADAIPGARLEVFDGLGHFGPLQDPTRVAAAAAAFFSTC